MLLWYKQSAVGVVVRVKIADSSKTTNVGLTGVTNASSGLNIALIADVEASTAAYTSAGSTIDTIATLGTYAAPSASHCRFKELDSTNHPGVYELQFLNTRFSVSSATYLLGTISGVTNMAQCDFVIQLTTINPYDANAGLTNLDAAVSSRMATYTLPTGFLSATFPSGTVANTTNITGGTITTTTNLTNLPSIPNNWITAAGIAASALNGKGDWSTYAGGDTPGTTTLLGRLTSTRAGNLDNLDESIVTAANAILSAVSSVPASVWAVVVDGTNSAIQLMRGFAAALLGKASGLDTDSPKYRNVADTKNVISATTDDTGNRTAVSLDLS